MQPKPYPQSEKERLAALVDATNRVLERPTSAPTPTTDERTATQEEEVRRASLRFPPRPGQ